LPACVLGQPIFPEQCSDDFRGWVRGRTGKRVGETSAGVSCSLRLRGVRRLRGVFYRVYGTRARSVFLLHPRRGVSPPPGSPPPPPRPSKHGLAKRRSPFYGVPICRVYIGKGGRGYLSCRWY